MLKHFCCEETAVKAINKEYQINVSDIEELSDEIVEIHYVSLKKYFTTEAWDMLAERGKVIALVCIRSLKFWLMHQTHAHMYT